MPPVKTFLALEMLLFFSLKEKINRDILFKNKRISIA